MFWRQDQDTALNPSFLPSEILHQHSSIHITFEGFIIFIQPSLDPLKMIFRKVSLLLAVACASSYAFVPSRTVVTPRTMAVQSQSASFAAQISTSAPSRSSARFMSDAAAAPEPEKKSVLEKVRTWNSHD